jgi:hypothetical protein
MAGPLLQLFYQWGRDQDRELEECIKLKSTANVETYFVEDHRKQYDHSDQEYALETAGGDCFCAIPSLNDPADTVWPKLLYDYKHIASGKDAIMNIDYSNIKKD